MKKQRILFLLIGGFFLAVLAFFFLTRASNLATVDDIQVRYQGQEFEMTIPFSLEPFTDEDGAQVVWRVLDASADDISFEFPDYDHFHAQNPVGKAKGKILHAGVFTFNLERSNPTDTQKEIYHLELTSNGQRITDIQISKNSK